MHRSGTSAVTGLISLCGVATCTHDDLIRGIPWNPRGHFESRSMTQLNDELLAQMGCSWWYPPPSGDGYREVLRRVETSTVSIRDAFRRAHPVAPWVWKDPRLCLTFPIWRRALPEVAAAVMIFRNPLDVARSLHDRNGFPLSFGVALWERYNRLALAHSGGMPVAVVRYDDLVDDPVGGSERLARFLGSVGLPVDSRPDAAKVRLFIERGLRHSSHTASALGMSSESALHVYEALESRIGSTRSFEPPELLPEPDGVASQLAALGPTYRPTWNDPPWSVDA
jgi:hypothetical protein